MKRSTKKILVFLLLLVGLANISPVVYARTVLPAKLDVNSDDVVVSSCILGYETPEEYLEKVNAGYPSEERRPTIRPSEENPAVDDTTLLVVIKQEYSNPYYHMTKEHFPGINLISIKEYLKAHDDGDLGLINPEGYRSILSLEFANNEDLEDAIALLENRNDIWGLSYNTYVTLVPEIPSSGIIYTESGELKAPEEGYGILFGDANMDDRITAEDAALTLQKVLDAASEIPVEDTDEGYFYYLDVDRDEMLTADDASRILMKVLNGAISFKTDGVTYAFNGADVGWSAFPADANGVGRLIESLEELDEFISEYVDGTRLEGSVLNKYSDSFFQGSKLAVSLFVGNYSEEYVSFDVNLSGSALEINTRTSIPPTRPDSQRYILQIMEINGNTDIDELNWQMIRHDELTGMEEIWQLDK